MYFLIIENIFNIVGKNCYIFLDIIAYVKKLDEFKFMLIDEKQPFIYKYVNILYRFLPHVF